MPQLVGREGAVSLDGNAIGEVRSWSLTIVSGSIGNNSMGSGDWDTSVGGRKSWSGELSMWYDPSDAGQSGIAVGDEIVVELMAEGETTGLELRTGTCRISELNISGDGAGDNLFEASIKFTGIGALTLTTVS